MQNSTNVFNIDNKKCFLSSKSANYDFLKDHVTLSNVWWKFGFAITAINNILKYKYIENYFEL